MFKLFKPTLGPTLLGSLTYIWFSHLRIGFSSHVRFVEPKLSPKIASIWSMNQGVGDSEEEMSCAFASLLPPALVTRTLARELQVSHGPLGQWASGNGDSELGVSGWTWRSHGPVWRSDRFLQYWDEDEQATSMANEDVNADECKAGGFWHRVPFWFAVGSC